MSNGKGRSTGGFGVDREESVNLIVRTALDHGVSDPKQIAYMLATAQHETRDFAAPEEDFGRSQARKLGYSGGEDFYGRGYVHLTHDYNYRKFDELLGLDGELVQNPDRAMQPELAARILVIGMRDGLFTGRRLDRYINDDSQDTYNARRVVNGITSQAWTVKAAEDCERYATVWEQAVPALIEKAREQEPATAHDWREQLQRTLDGIVSRPRADPPGTKDGLPDFQLWNGLETSGVLDQATRQLLHAPPAKAAALAPDGPSELGPAQARTFSDPTNPSHPDHAMYDRIRAGVRAIDEANGKSYDHASERISRNLLARCKGADACPGPGAPAAPGVALRRVDHVLMGSTGNVFAIEGRLDDPAHRRASVCVAEAVQVSVEESDRRLAAVSASGEREREIGLTHPATLGSVPPSAGPPCMTG